MSSQLALFGGKPIREKPFPPYYTIGEEEKRAVMQVLDTKILSYYIGAYREEFYGGPMVKKVEREWESYFGVKHAITVNSATSGLYTAIGALGIGPGDEVIVPPYTMSASASAILIYNAIPVFVDVDEDTFCINPLKIKQAITPRTKAIMVVHLFGHPADMDEIIKVAREHNLTVIEDAAQSPGALYKGKYAGTIGDIGVFSLNCHKTIQTGEGGVIVTNDSELARRLQLIRNHAEAVVEGMGVTNLVNMIGWNYRMTEIESAIASEQLKKLNTFTQERIERADYLTEKLKGLDGITPPVVMNHCKHVYYMYVLKIDEQTAGISRKNFVSAIVAEGIPHTEGYAKPFYLMPIYQKKIVFGEKGCPFTCGFYNGSVRYEQGLCTVVEDLYYNRLFYHGFIYPPLTKSDLDDIVNAYYKVFEHKYDFKE
jgi:dTDP-4-amino-4,6-dideoxygalactose transaminase